MDEKYPLALSAGTVLAGQYIIEKVLGQGGFGITYEAKDHKTNARVAVKEFFPDAMATRTNQTTVSAFSGERGESFAYGKTCFLQEAETLAKFIGNENIVRIHSYFEENGTAYFVMDFVEGTSFDDYLKQRGGKIPYEEAAKILIPVMDALSVVHSQGIVHRDVTPDNIYITQEGVVKLLDFGAARYSLGDKSRSLDIILKHGFAPKEQYTRRGKQGPYTDVYALGATFYFALTGKRPPDSVERLDEDDLVPPSSLGVQISGAAEDAILQALSVQPGDRFQSMTAFKNALLSSQQPAAVQPPLAAVGSQSTVSQTYFSAPEQTGIPHTGTTGSPAPAQDADLQDLAATMKTAGKLAGKLAGKMAGKMAEKTAETAGIMAGTAGKMSEIMAAKKAETAEKLAAKAAEWEAEKAARAAEKAAQQAAAEAARQAAEQAAAEAAQQAAAEAAENPAGDAPENTVGKTAGDTVGRTAEGVGKTVGVLSGGGTAAPPAAPPNPPKKKNLLPVALAAAAVVVVLVILVAVFMPKGSQPGSAADNRESEPVQTTDVSQQSTTAPMPTIAAEPEVTDEPEPTATPEPPQTPSGSFAVVGNYTGNIMCGGYVTAAPDGTNYWVDSGGTSLYSGNGYIYEDYSGYFMDLSYDSGMLFFRYDNSAYAYNSETDETVELTYLSDFAGNIVRLFLTKDYYVVGNLNEDYTVTVYLVSRSDGQVFECCTALGANMFTISDDGLLYYIGREENISSDSTGIYCVNMATLERELTLTSLNDPDYHLQCPVVADDYLYVILYSESDKSIYNIIRVDRFNGYVDGTYPICAWNISSEIKQAFLTRVQLEMNVTPQTHDIFFSMSVVDSAGYYLFKIKGYDNNTFDLEQISQKAHRPNILYHTDGSYELYYMHCAEDESTYQLYYLNYDADGNLITN